MLEESQGSIQLHLARVRSLAPLPPHPSSKATARSAPSVSFPPTAAIEIHIFADPRHALRSFAPVLFRSIAVFRKPLLILFRQAGKFLPYKRKELLCRRRHQEQHAGEKPLHSRLLRRRRYGF